MTKVTCGKCPICVADQLRFGLLLAYQSSPLIRVLEPVEKILMVDRIAGCTAGSMLDAAACNMVEFEEEKEASGGAGFPKKMLHMSANRIAVPSDQRRCSLKTTGVHHREQKR
jgi:hypothetical protein